MDTSETITFSLALLMLVFAPCYFVCRLILKARRDGTRATFAELTYVMGRALGPLGTLVGALVEFLVGKWFGTRPEKLKLANSGPLVEKPRS